MSLAQRIERPHLLIGGDKRPQVPLPRVGQPLDLLDITRRTIAAPVPSAAPAAALVVAAPELAEAAPTLPAALPTMPGARDADVAFDLLNEVAKALPNLIARCEQLQNELSSAQEAAKAEIDAANELSHEWQQIAAALKLQVDGLERGLKVMRQRAEAAEGRVASLRDETEKSQHAAAEAECLSSLFQEKVIASFGANSLMHPILEAYRTKGERSPA